MKNNIPFFFLIVLLLFLSCSSDDSNNTNNDNTDNPPVNSSADISSIVSMFDNIDGVSYVIEDDFIEFTTNGVPNHTSPYWGESHPMYETYNGTNPDFNLNPNLIGSQNIVFRIPRRPEEAEVKEATRLGPIGISVNGVVFFNQYAGPDNQPLTDEINSFDQFAGHPTGGSLYHYHIEPLFLTNTLGRSSFLGLLADGFPVYGPEENNVMVTSDDLDEYHGHTHTTTDFPDEIYHYHITLDDPYINGNGYFGTPGNISQ
ncbi:YHYH protein [Aquimarina sp. 433]